jgi:hypothetical protein
MTEEEHIELSKLGAELLTGLVDKNFIDPHGKWTQTGNAFTDMHISRQFYDFAYHTQRQNNFTDYENAYRYCYDQKGLWLCRPGNDSYGWDWYRLLPDGSTSFNTYKGYIENTARILEVNLNNIADLETFDEDDMLDI